MALFSGCILYAIALSQCLVPYTIVTGGVSGIAVTWHALTAFPVGFSVFLINLPLFMYCWRTLGRQYAAKTLLCVLLSSLCTALCEQFPPLTDDVFLSAVLGGGLLGLSAGLLLPCGFTTGGSDLAAFLLQKRFPRISIGGTVALLDGCIVLSGALLLRHFDGLLYSLTTICSCSLVLEFVLRRSNRNLLLLVIAENTDCIAEAIRFQLPHDAAILYDCDKTSEIGSSILLCTIRPPSVVLLKNIIRGCDANAHWIMLDSIEISAVDSSHRPV